MNDTGKLTLNLKKLDDEKVEIAFIDTGAGIAAENIDKLFQPLFTTKSRGFGFGLSICKMIMDKHNGNIEIKSDLGKGTTVILTFPLDSIGNYNHRERREGET